MLCLYSKSIVLKHGFSQSNGLKIYILLMACDIYNS